MAQWRQKRAGTEAEILARYDRLRESEPDRLARMLSSLPDEMTFAVEERPDPKEDGFGLRWRAAKRANRVVAPPKSRLVKRFIRNPETESGQEYTEAPEFGWDLLRYCSEYVDAVPAQGQRLAKTALVLFLRNKNKGLPEAGCQAVSARGILAMSDFHLDRLEEAELTLQQSLEGVTCSGCKAGAFRKSAVFGRERGYLGLDTTGYEIGIERGTAAIELYLDPNTVDHDLLGEGLANSYMTRGMIACFAGDCTKALEDLSASLELILPKLMPRLYRQNLKNTACILLKSNDQQDLVIAHEIALMARRYCSRMRKACTQRARAYWLEGQICYRLGATRYAVECMENARDDFLDLKAGVNVVAVTADLSQVAYPNRAWIRDYIHDLDLDRTSCCPLWIPPDLQAGLSRVYRICCTGEQGLKKAIERLREATAGASGMPCLLARG